MKRAITVVVALVVSFLFCFGSFAFGADSAGVKEVRTHIGKFKNEEITITGFINRFEPSDARSTRFYKLRDDLGDTISVRTASKLPDVGKRFAVKGVVTIDRDKSDTIFLSESTRLEVLSGPTEEEIKIKLINGPLSSAEQALSAGNFAEAIQYGNQVLSLDPMNQRATQIKGIAQKKLEEQNQKKLDEQNRMWILIGVASVVFLILVVVLIVILMKRSRAGEEMVTETITPGFVDEGKTVVMKRPPEGTMKLIPGKFIVLKGEDSKKEIRFQLPQDVATKEFTFGRQDIPEQNPYGHIQLKAQTVSRIQAKLLFTDKGFTLTNNSSVNPTTINGRSLKENEAADLKDGDVIAMGEVEFKYEVK